jgi:hypothetical protein
VLFAAAPAAAQTWKEYAYPKDFFSIALPAEAETTTWQTADGSESDAIRFQQSLAFTENSTNR